MGGAQRSKKGMHEIERWIVDAAATLAVVIERQPPELSKAIIEEARSNFVLGNPRAWWMSLKPPVRQFQSETVGLTSVLPSAEGGCWFIPETDREDVAVFRLEAGIIRSLLDGCPFFEYYVLADDLRWLVCESDHNVFYVSELGRG